MSSLDDPLPARLIPVRSDHLRVPAENAAGNLL